MRTLKHSTASKGFTLIPRLRSGFTLIELLVVIAIIGLLASVVMVSLSSARVKARDAKRTQNIKSIKTAMELYYYDQGMYPPASCGENCGVDIATLTGPLAPYIKLPSIVEGTSQVSADNYVRGFGGYGIRVYIEKTSSYCKTGVNVNNAENWWGVGFPICDF